MRRCEKKTNRNTKIFNVDVLSQGSVSHLFIDSVLHHSHGLREE